MIEVTWEVNVSEGSSSFSFEELNTTEIEWTFLSPSDKEERLQEALDARPDEVYAMLDKWKEP